MGFRTMQLKGLETILGIGGRHGLKGGIHKFFGWLQRHHVNVFNDVAFVYTDPKAAGVKSAFTSGLIAVAVLVENIGDAVKVPEPVMQLIETIFGDLPGSIQDYFDITKPTLPAGYTGPKELTAESMKALAGRFNELLKGYLRENLAQWFKPFRQLFGLFTDKTERMMQTLLDLDGPSLGKFTAFVKSLSRNDRTILAQMVQFMDEPDEMAGFVNHSPKRMRELFSWMKLMKDQALWKRALKLAKDNWPVLEREMKKALRSADRGLAEVEQKVERSNRRRRREIRREEQQNALPPTGQRLVNDKRVWVLAALTAFAVIVVCGVTISGCNAHPPVVHITSPQNMAKVLKPAIITGEARDENEVVSMEYQVNDGGRLPLKFSGSRRARWSFTLDSLSYGKFYVRVFAHGASGRVGSSELELFRPEPVVQDSTATDSTSVADSTTTKHDAEVSVAVDSLGHGEYSITATKRIRDRADTSTVRLKVVR